MKLIFLSLFVMMVTAGMQGSDIRMWCSSVLKSTGPRKMACMEFLNCRSKPPQTAYRQKAQGMTNCSVFVSFPILCWLWRKGCISDFGVFQTYNHQWRRCPQNAYFRDEKIKNCYTKSFNKSPQKEEDFFSA